jgi:hypothetical protein
VPSADSPQSQSQLAQAGQRDSQESGARLEECWGSAQRLLIRTYEIRTVRISACSCAYTQGACLSPFVRSDDQPADFRISQLRFATILIP